MGANREKHIKIAARSAAQTGMALVLIAHARAVFDAGGNGNLDDAFLGHAGLALALAAGVGDDASDAAAFGAGARHAEETLLILHLSASAAGRARDRAFAGGRARALAQLAGLVTVDLHFGLFAEGRLFKCHHNIGPAASALLRTTPPPPPHPPHLHPQDLT